MDSVVEIVGANENGRILSVVKSSELAALVLDSKKIVLLKNVFPNGFIVSMSKYGSDYQSGGTVFDIDGTNRGH